MKMGYEIMKELEFDVELKTSDLFCFSMRHSYLSISGLFGVIISVGSLVYLLFNYSALEETTCMALAIIGCLFTLVQPVMLYVKSRAQVQRNKDINAPLHYVISEEGILVSQGEAESMMKWEYVRKKIVTAGALYLYMSPVRAFIFPKKQCGECFEQVCDIAEIQMKKQSSEE